MRSDRQRGRRAAPRRDPTQGSRWRDRKRYLWLFSLIIPILAFSSVIAVKLTGLTILWWAGPIVTFGIIPAIDRIIGSDANNPPGSVLSRLQDDGYYRWVTYLYLPIQYLSLLLACWLWSDSGWLAMDFVDKLGLMLTVGGIGGVAINAAHELGHKRARSERWLSKVALAQSGYGHFFVEHNRGHHSRVATAEDPASARMGEGLYAFIPRSVLGGMRSAWRIEGRRLTAIRRSRWSMRNDVLYAWMMSVTLFTTLVACFGFTVLPWLIGQAIVGFSLLETVNYIEHYGLRRQRLPSGRYEPVCPSHSWNSSTVTANLFLFQLQRHSDHHAHPLRRYQALCHADDAPQLPAGYLTMVLLAMFPPLWRRIMDPRVVEHYGGDVRLAALSPRAEHKVVQRYSDQRPLPRAVASSSNSST
ncbi:alkane 1-monooxygenase [Mycolicibacterium hodleri]|uniref:Alkane 1-monooxygenase n=1 Tax=Mycolicibacterium hodleri TaxID=49897 RepID=A0A502E620_9MYCO|nr:alkane 1-monooxygenase [Mycolicibacterium hodleri]TPG32262.1 alkane 1-monooxygenase [Mycolicibacterium hodleri]